MDILQLCAPNYTLSFSHSLELTAHWKLCTQSVLRSEMTGSDQEQDLCERTPWTFSSAGDQKNSPEACYLQCLLGLNYVRTSPSRGRVGSLWPRTILYITLLSFAFWNGLNTPGKYNILLCFVCFYLGGGQGWFLTCMFMYHAVSSTLIGQRWHYIPWN